MEGFEQATRLLVKSLPKQADEKQLIQHLEKSCRSSSSQLGLTDCRVIRHNGRSRRFAFIGFMSSAQAEKAMASIDQTFMGTSRLIVTVAYEEGSKEIPREWSQVTKKRRQEAELTAAAKSDSRAAASSTESTDENLEESLRLAAETGRLRILNLAYETTEEMLKTKFETLGQVAECNLIIDVKTSKSRGLAFITYAFPPDASKALLELNGTILHGRKIKVEAAEDTRDASMLEKVMGVLGTSSRAKEQIAKKKLERAQDSRNWNLLYVSSSVAAEVMANHLGLQQEEVMDVSYETSDSLAARAAISESFVIAETKKWLQELGADEQVFIRRNAYAENCDGGEKSTTTLIVKHLGPWIDEDEVKKLFSRFGRLTRFTIAPTKTIAVVNYRTAAEAKRAVQELLLYNLRNHPLYIEYAPASLDVKSSPVEESRRLEQNNVNETSEAGTDSTATPPSSDGSPAAGLSENLSNTIYVTNLHFETTEDEVAAIFQDLEGFRKVSVLNISNICRTCSCNHAILCMTIIRHPLFLFILHLFTG